MTTVQIPGTLDFPVNYLVIKATPLPFIGFALIAYLIFPVIFFPFLIVSSL